MISIDIDDREVIAALTRLRDRAGDAGLKPALERIGIHMVESTQQRFETSTGPDGARWAPNARSTLERLLAGTTGGVGKRGKITAKGAGAMMGKRPLILSDHLRTSIHWQHIPGGVAVGTNRFAKPIIGAALQFGSKDGHIPARPFLGMSDDDRRNILAIIEAHFAGT